MDPAPITRHLRAMYSSRLLIAAVNHLKVFDYLADKPLSLAELQDRLALKERPAMVLFPALCAMGMLEINTQGKYTITGLGNFLNAQTSPNLVGYLGLEKDDPGVLEMTDRLLNDGPAEQAAGISYVKEGEGPSPMDQADSARVLTLALAGRAQHLSPIVADKMTRREGHLLDIAGGTGLYTYEWLLLNPRSTATVFDRPQVLAVAAELLEQFGQSARPGAKTVKERVKFLPGNMLSDFLPATDLILAASLFHDWPTETCESLARRFADSLKPGGELWVHDVFLNDTLEGPLAVTDYSAQLFWVTKGRAYSRKEYRGWMAQAGLAPTHDNIPTQMDYGLIWAHKP